MCRQWRYSGGPTMVEHGMRGGMRGAVVGWYLPVLVVDEKKLNRNEVRVVVMMRKVAVGKAAGGFEFEQAVGIRSREEWYRHNWR